MRDLIICRCEEVSLKDLEETAKKYNCSARELKLRTRAGMGFCGGRTCRPAVDKVLTNLTKEDPTNAIPLKVAPPVRPLSITDLGGAAKDE
ncbi:(2Fe-2S)-binding protein [Pseudogracilibacillus sp. SO30301A]|uniref:(2Fe-2S)-binding protein n=1 Tax=Pseudogracilibacillus sp. SO30301A TaxID=3098291 RepID=UPI00300E3B72